MNSTPLLSAVNLHKSFNVASQKQSKSSLTAVDDVSLQLFSGETVGIAGESGCGKSTLAKLISGLLVPDAGNVFYKGTPLKQLNPTMQSTFRRKTQMIFQDPFSSLNPRMRVGDIISEPLKIAGAPIQQQLTELHRIIAAVGLPQDAANRFPDEFSGGQRQRIGIARALTASPEILIADEPVSSLDISVQAQIINILLQMKLDFSLSMIIVSHNLLVLRHICDRILIMYLGVVVECGTTADIFVHCRHPYTKALISSIPGVKHPIFSAGELLRGDLPSPMTIPTGCRFHPRCRHAIDLCRNEAPTMKEHNIGHTSACHLSTNLYNQNSAPQF